MKLSDTTDQNPPCIFDKIREKTHSDEKSFHSLTLRAKVKVIAKTKKTMPQRAINMTSTKKMNKDLPNYWCPNDVKYVMNDPPGADTARN